MAIHVRRKRNVTPRFKPDMWGRDPGSEGEVLFEGTLELEEAEGSVALDSPMVAGKMLAITLDGQTVTAETVDYEGAVVASFPSINFEGAVRNMSIAMPPGEETAYIEFENVEPQLVGGEYSLKIVQS